MKMTRQEAVRVVEDLLTPLANFNPEKVREVRCELVLWSDDPDVRVAEVSFRGTQVANGLYSGTSYMQSDLPWDWPRAPLLSDSFWP